MEAEEIQTQPRKFVRVGSNGRSDTTKLGLKGSNSNCTNLNQYPDSELKRVDSNAIVGAGGGNRLRGWHHSSRIIRVSRASGGKDRHSKVWTSKGLRDRRVRLSVTTAIQFYDLQDRLGYDQPSKAVEWLIKAAADAVSELPSLSSSFPETPKQLSDEKKRGGDDNHGTEHGFDSADLELEDPNFSLGSGDNSQNQRLSLSKSACSSTSETSKGSGLSLSRSDARVKARERARERTAKEKENDEDHPHQNVSPHSQNETFTELLTGGISGTVSNSNNNHSDNNTSSPAACEANFFHKAAAARQWPLTPMDYFGTGLLGPSSSSRSTDHSSGFPGQIQLGNSIISQAMIMSIPPFHISGENHHQHQNRHHQEQMQHFPFDHLIPVATPTTTSQPGSGGDYNLDFTISSGLSCFNRGTLQSNSTSVHSLFPHLQRFSSSPLEGSTSVPFFIGGAPQQSMENNHHHHQFPPGLQLCYADGVRHSHDQKGKGKN